jgi:hypothetical protein
MSRTTSPECSSAATASAQAASTAATVAQHGAEDLDHLAVAVVNGGKLAANALDRPR